MAFKPVGPCQVYVGDFTASPSVTELVDVESVSIDLGIKQPYTSNANLDGAPTADGLYYGVPNPQIQLTLVDADLAQITALLPLTTTTASSQTGLGLGSSFTAIAEASVPSMFILPRQQNASGVNAANGIWIPAARISGFSGLNFGRTGDQEILQPYTVNVQACYRATDQDSTAIPAAARVLFFGSPTAFGLTWALS